MGQYFFDTGSRVQVDRLTMHDEAEAILAELAKRWAEIDPYDFAKRVKVSRPWLVALVQGRIPDPSVNRMLRVRDALKAQFG